jgi:lon-related putative ATP-dependent protease
MKKPKNALEVTPEALRWTCKPSQLGIRSTENVKPLDTIIGQDRAVRALKVGLEMKHEGYNIFATGVPGTGRTTTITRMLREYAARPATLLDKCYVYNFRDPDSPTMLSFPAGQGLAFKKDMDTFLAELQKGIPGVFESRRYVEQRKSLLEHFQDRQRTILKDFEKKVKEKGFEVVQVQGAANARPEIAFVLDGNPVGMENMIAKADAGEISREQLTTLTAQQAELEGQMDIIMREMRNIERKAKKSIDDLNHRIIVPVVEELLIDLQTKYKLEPVRQYLAAVKKAILENLQRFHQKEEPQTSVLGLSLPREEDTFVEFQVNVLVDNGPTKGVPLIIETNPRFKNLFGTIERSVDRNGVWRSDFLHIKAGSIVKANGGYLVINALDALSEPGVWTMLKRVLRNMQIEIQPIESGLLGASSALKPEPIDLDVKVIMIGDSYIYHTVYGLDDDFKKIFKIRADFDVEMPNVDESIDSYVSFIRTLCEAESLRPFDVTGVVEVVEYGARLAGRQDKLSTRFSLLADILREASFWAGKAGVEQVSCEHVRKAIDERIERVRMVEEKIQEMINNGSIMIDTDKSVVGQVNGLSVYQLGEFEFGRPSRITTKTGMGKAGIVNIEREAAMSGPMHNKGMLILGGYLLGKFAQNKPLVLSATTTFEQSYGGVDGDSASSTEVYAILSSLSGIPLRQDIAVTGSVNQHGDIQPIGGVNLKVEGFFDVCNARGLTGKQGVMIPHQNVKELMLRHDVVDAVKKGKFHIYGIHTIDEGIELLTGKPAGVRSKSRKYTPRSVNALVDRKLEEFARQSKKF